METKGESLEKGECVCMCIKKRMEKVFGMGNNCFVIINHVIDVNYLCLKEDKEIIMCIERGHVIHSY